MIDSYASTQKEGPNAFGPYALRFSCNPPPLRNQQL